MLQWVLLLRPALVPAIANCPDLDVELSNSEFVLIEKVCKILTFFEQATKMMSEGDASISNIQIKHQKSYSIRFFLWLRVSGIPRESGRGRD